jgi:hypothetical protein
MEIKLNKKRTCVMKVSDAIVNRFLSWRLPDDFNPDCGVSFAKPNHPTSWPVGTNLLTATQTRQMLEYVLDGNEPKQGTDE